MDLCLTKDGNAEKTVRNWNEKRSERDSTLITVDKTVTEVTPTRVNMQQLKQKLEKMESEREHQNSFGRTLNHSDFIETSQKTSPEK